MWNEEGIPIRAVGSITDITERKLAQAAILKLNQELEARVQERTEALRKSENHLAQAQQVGHVGSWEFDLITLSVTWSPETFRIFGRDPQLGEPSYEKLLQYIHPEDREMHTVEFNRGIAEKKSVEINYRILRLDGSFAYFRAKGKPFFDESGKPLRYLGTVIDITSTILAEQQLQKLNQELLRSNQELEQFASIASHDLQEPLRAITSYSKFLEADYHHKLDKSAHEYIYFISDAASRMQQLIQDLLAYSRVTTRSKEFVTVDCNQVMEQAIRNLQIAISESHATIIYDPLPIISADKGQLVQLFQNLIGNAIKFRGQKSTCDSDWSQKGGRERTFSHYMITALAFILAIPKVFLKFSVAYIPVENFLVRVLVWRFARKLLSVTVVIFG
ncbi:MAG: PAS domain-containing protein [Calothrix sp. SM1_7_51]|nr:PAS domain-containing protein [Calothrix sp. SM1_7_51]